MFSVSVSIWTFKVYHRIAVQPLTMGKAQQTLNPIWGSFAREPVVCLASMVNMDSSLQGQPFNQFTIALLDAKVPTSKIQDCTGSKVPNSPWASQPLSC
eukprot:scaffold1955_cov106-Skeletonema_dohrnii-CCMP3373.AAC.14